MTKSSKQNNFIRQIKINTGEEVYRIQFNFGVHNINVQKNKKITFNFVHNDFREVFSRSGDDLIIGSDCYLAIAHPLGTGYGKEVWVVSKNNDSTYSITVRKYDWLGQDTGYSNTPKTTETLTMTSDEFNEFKATHNITLKNGSNVLYTTWAVLPQKVVHYHMEDKAFYSPSNGKIILKNYFKYGKDTIYIGDRLLSDILKENPQFEALLTANRKNPRLVYDTFFDETLTGSDFADTIYSNLGNDTIDSGKGNDRIFLGEGNKTVLLNEGNGKDTVFNFEKADSVNFVSDTDNVYFTKSGNDLILNRKYFDKTETTVIKNYFINMKKDNDIIVSSNTGELVSDFTQALKDGDIYLTATGSTVIRGTEYNDIAYSSGKNEWFYLGKGNNIINFQTNDFIKWYPYHFGEDTVVLTKGSKLTLNFDNAGGNISVFRNGNDAVVTSRYRIPVCGCDYGKEEWTVKKAQNNTYNIVKTKFYFTGNGYEASDYTEQTTLTAEEFSNFQKDNDIRLKIGQNTLYTSWAVVPNPRIRYSYRDWAYYGVFLGSVTLKNYFLFNEDNVFIGDKSLKEYFRPYERIVAPIYVIYENNQNNENTGEWTCEYPVPQTSELLQEVTAWQTNGTDIPIEKIQTAELSQQPVLVPVQ